MIVGGVAKDLFKEKLAFDSQIFEIPNGGFYIPTWNKAAYFKDNSHYYFNSLNYNILQNKVLFVDNMLNVQPFAFVSVKDRISSTTEVVENYKNWVIYKDANSSKNFAAYTPNNEDYLILYYEGAYRPISVEDNNKALKIIIDNIEFKDNIDFNNGQIKFEKPISINLGGGYKFETQDFASIFQAENENYKFTDYYSWNRTIFAFFNNKLNSDIIYTFSNIKEIDYKKEATGVSNPDNLDILHLCLQKTSQELGVNYETINLNGITVYRFESKTELINTYVLIYIFQLDSNVYEIETYLNVGKRTDIRNFFEKDFFYYYIKKNN